MIRFRKHFEDLIFQCGMPCAGYIPHMYNKHKYLCDNHKIDAMLLYGSRRLNAVRKKNKRKEGTKNE